MKPVFDEIRPLIEALRPHEVRVVGGAVRAWLRKDPLQGVDVDMAVAATPDEIEQKLHAAGIVTTDEGKRWGTITAHLNGETYEMTALRTDEYMPGSRYPTVKFGVDWETDAARRDFTFNAVYVDEHDGVFDPYNGVDDLKNGIVRFIGDPEKRMAEDPLRLYRFWRFCAIYGVGGVTPEIVECSRNAVAGLFSASRNRRGEEWHKIAEAPQGATVMAELERHGLFEGMKV